MPDTPPTFDGTLLHFRLFLKLGAKVCPGLGGASPSPCFGNPGKTCWQRNFPFAKFRNVYHWLPILTNNLSTSIILHFLVDHSRVLIGEDLQNEPRQDYINANYINVSWTSFKHIQPETWFLQPACVVVWSPCLPCNLGDSDSSFGRTSTQGLRVIDQKRRPSRKPQHFCMHLLGYGP